MNRSHSVFVKALANISLLLCIAMQLRAQKATVVAPVGHIAGGQKVVFSKDGKILVTGDDLGTIKFWDVATGKLLHTGHQAVEKFERLTVSPDNQFVACALENGEVNVWSLKDGSLYTHFFDHTMYVGSAFFSFSADSRYLASASSNEDTLTIWNLHEKKLEKKIFLGEKVYTERMVGTTRYKEQSNLNTAITFIGETDRIGVTRGDTIFIWDWKKEGILARLKYAIDFSKDRLRSYSLHSDTIQIQNLETGKIATHMAVQDSLMISYCIVGDDVFLYVSKDRMLHKLDLKTGKENFSTPCHIEMSKWSDHQYLVFSLEATADGNYCFLSDSEGNGQLFDLHSGKLMVDMPKLPEYISYQHVVFNEQGNLLAIAGPEKEAATMWDLQKLQKRSIGQSLTINANASLLLKNNLLLSYNEEEIHGFEIARNRIAWQLDIKGWNSNLSSLHPDSRYLVMWKDDSLVAVRNPQDGSIMLEMNTGKKNQVKAEMSVDGKYLMVITVAQTIVYSLPYKTAVLTVPHSQQEAHSSFVEDAIEPAMLSTDSKHLLCVNRKSIYKSFDLATGKLIDSVFIGKDRFPKSIMQSPDGTKVCIYWWSHDEMFGNLTVLDYESSKILWSNDEHYAWLENIEFSKNNKWVITTSIKGGDAEIRDAKTGIKAGSVAMNIQMPVAGYINNCKYIYSQGSDGTAIIWNSSDLKPLYYLNGISHLTNGPGDSVLVATTPEGGVKFFDPETLSEKATFYLMKDKGWFAVNPNGLFDVSANTASQLHFVLNDTTNTEDPWSIIEFRQLKERYFQPGLLAAIFGYSKEPLRTVPGLDRTQFPPKVNLELQNDKMQISVSNAGGGCGKVSLYIDNIEVDENLLSNNDEKYDGHVGNFILNIDLNKYAHFIAYDTVNEIKVVAWNAEKWLSSRPVNIMYKPTSSRSVLNKNYIPKTAKATPSFYALVMGTSDYLGESIDLRFASKDAQDFASAIQLSAAKLFGKDRTHIYLLHSDAKEDSLLPYRQTFVKRMDYLSTVMQPEDILLVYLSGHGVNYGGQDGDFYYLTAAAGGAEANYLQDPAIRTTVAISSKELTQMLNKIVARKKVLILDACASGKAAEAMTVAMRDVPASQTRALDRMADRTGFYVLSGSAADAVSYESSMFGQGLLTYSLLKGIRGAALRMDGSEEYVDVARLMQFAVDEVPQLARDIDGIQQPLYRSPDDQQSYDVGLVDDSVKDEIKLATPKPFVLAASFINSMENEDDLKFADMVNARFREITARGRSAELVFTEAKSFPGAWKLSGSYKVNGNDIIVDYRLRRNETKIDRTIKGSTTDLIGLISKLLDEVKHAIEP